MSGKGRNDCCKNLATVNALVVDILSQVDVRLPNKPFPPFKELASAIKYKTEAAQLAIGHDSWDSGRRPVLIRNAVGKSNLRELFKDSDGSCVHQSQSSSVVGLIKIVL